MFPYQFQLIQYPQINKYSSFCLFPAFLPPVSFAGAGGEKNGERRKKKKLGKKIPFVLQTKRRNKDMNIKH